ncbi:MAG: hypothetical protein Q9159_007463, partial [Coniocarpon cinnabarinum]
MSAIPNLPESVISRGVNGVSKNGASKNPQVSDPGHVHYHSDVKRLKTTGGAFDPTNHEDRRQFKLREHPVENPRPLRIVIIGAGLSGIYAGIRIPERLPNITLTIYEKNGGVGGTWRENKYPGCACDVPSHSYQYSFEPNPDWSSLYASSTEIEAYLVKIADKYHVHRFVRLSHQVEDCQWDGSKWRLRIHDINGAQTIHDSADVLISARGGLSNLAWPSIPGLDQFGGKLMHSARWDQAFDCSNKRIGVIGNGSSGIQILPQVQKLPGTKITSFARSSTWISPSFGTPEVFEKAGIKGPPIPDDTRAGFNNDPAYYQRFRIEVEEDQCRVHEATLLDTPMQVEGQKLFEKNMRQKLASKPEVMKTLLPRFPPGCRRLTPGPGYLEALTKENVEFVSTEIAAIEASGVRTQDGKLHELDVLVTATGFHTDFKPPFGVRGWNGKRLQEHWDEYPRSYLSVATDAFPNLFFVLGPNAAIGAGSLTLMIESEVDYAIKCARKLQKENIVSMTVRSDRVDDFVEYCDEYFKRTVYGTECKSWYKNKQGRVSGLWPGATLHCIESLRSPRWEDYEYDYGGDDADPTVRENRLAWLGNGWSINMLEDHDLAWYLYPEFVEVPQEIPENHKKNLVRMFSP